MEDIFPECITDIIYSYIEEECNECKYKFPSYQGIIYSCLQCKEKLCVECIRYNYRDYDKGLCNDCNELKDDEENYDENNYDDNDMIIDNELYIDEY